MYICALHGQSISEGKEGMRLFMNNQRRKFNQQLKVNLNNSEPNKVINCDPLNSLLYQLRLQSENINTSISDDGKFIEISLNKSDYYKGPLKFRLPIQEENLDAFYNHPEHKELLDRYELYKKEYINIILKYFADAMKFLRPQFPEFNLSCKARIKSEYSYVKKVNQHILDNKPLNISDIIAARIIVSSPDKNIPASILIKKCYEVAELLEQFMQTTNFSIKHIDSSLNSAPTDKSYLTKDYIETPKENGYQSLHITAENSNLSFELQIRTSDMEMSSKKDEKIAHSNYKLRLLNDLSEKKVPIYAQITSFFDGNGDLQILYPTLEEAFYHYSSIPHDVYRKELDEVQKYINFEDIRKQLRVINSLNQSNETLVEEEFVY